MISEIEIENYKSIGKLKLELGRINVFIGENGAGKSNILEVIALAGAAAADKLDNEFLSSRGIRVTTPEYMRAAFTTEDLNGPILIGVKGTNDETLNFELNNDNGTYSKWQCTLTSPKLNFTWKELGLVLQDIQIKSGDQFPDNPADKKPYVDFLKILAENIHFPTAGELDAPTIQPKKKGDLKFSIERSKFSDILTKNTFALSRKDLDLGKFVIFSPENSALRTFQREGQIEPLGINGEGLLKLLMFYAQQDDQKELDQIKKSLKVLDWFDDFETITSSNDGKLLIHDRYLAKGTTSLDHRSTNEGFFFLLFYFSLFTSKLTPNFFAIDNIDASLNPKLCQKMVIELTKLAKNNAKQAILTTHNPAILDGLNLDDDEQRLFVVSRSRNGSTKIKRIFKPIAQEGKKIPKLSELFLDGMIGGLPKGF
jgi:AAA15 family ATPase/GTPase